MLNPNHMPTLAILHGWGDSAESWKNAGASLPESNVIAIDLPGFGKEPLISGDWGVLEYAEWTEKKIKQLGVINCILLGHSFGGRIAGLIASMNPPWLKGVILYAAPCIYRPNTSVTIKKSLAKIAHALGIRGGYFKSEELQNADTAGLGKIFRNVVNFDETSVLSRISIPTLIIWGSQDTTVSSDIGKEMQSLIPNSELALLYDLGHYAHIENPTLFYGTITRFISNL